MIRFWVVLGASGLAIGAGILGLAYVPPAASAAALLAIDPVIKPTKAQSDAAAREQQPGPVMAPAPAARGPAASANPLSGIPLASLSATWERPIFSPSRRPPPVIAAPRVEAVRPAPPPAEPDRPPLTLVGTVIGDTKLIGVFLDPVTKDMVRLKSGEAHAGWTLRSIQGREASFERNRRTAVLSLPRPDTVPARSPALAAAPAAAPSASASAQASTPVAGQASVEMPLLVPGNGAPAPFEPSTN